MDVVALILSHRTAPLEVLERVACPGEEAVALLGRLREAAGRGDAAVLSTCNRTEAYLAVPGGEPLLRRLLAERAGLSAGALARHLEVRRGLDAVRHLMAVACGLESVVLGEAQILGQVGRAAELARQAGCLGPVMGRLLPRAVRAGRRARQETGIGRGVSSVSQAAVELARQVWGSLEGRRVVVLGAGKTGASALRFLRSAGAEIAGVVNRTPARAEELARRCGCEAVPYGELDRALEECHVLLTSTSAPHPILTRPRLEAVMRARGGRPLLVVDIALPRDVDPECAGIPDVYLYDLADLKRAVAGAARSRKDEAAAVRALVEREAARCAAELEALRAAPAIRRLRHGWGEIQRQELDRIRGGRRLDPGEEERLQRLAHRLLARLLHAPTVALRNLAGGGAQSSELHGVLGLLGVDPPGGTNPA